MKYSQEDILHARRLECRFSLLNLINECKLKYKDFFSKLVDDKDIDCLYNIFDWVELGKEFEQLLKYYDNGVKLNEDVILSLKYIKLKNIVAVKRVIKLIKII